MNEAKCLEASRSLAPTILKSGVSADQNRKLSIPRPKQALSRAQGVERISVSQSGQSLKESWRPSQGVPPPVTVTGVAPWAMSQSPRASRPCTQSARRPAATGETHLPTKKNMQEEACPGHGEILLEYMERCRLHGGRDAQPGDWLQAQAAPAPTRLPELRFHDLVFGR